MELRMQKFNPHIGPYCVQIATLEQFHNYAGERNESFDLVQIGQLVEKYNLTRDGQVLSVENGMVSPGIGAIDCRVGDNLIGELGYADIIEIRDGTDTVIWKNPLY